VPTLLGLVFLMNVFAATMDIAVDGLAVDLLAEHELGYGNSSQVVGYKVGMLTGGGLLIYAAGELGWGVLLSLMAGIVGLIFLFTLTWAEPPPRPSHAPPAPDPATSPVSGATTPPPRRSVGAVVSLVFRAMEQPGASWFLLYIATYKIGEGMVDVMFKPFLIDRGVTPQQVGLWLGTYGMVASITGSLAGGWAASRLPMWWALVGVTALRVIPMIGEWWVAVHPSTDTAIIALTALEHLFGGALTTIVFAFMMSRVDARVGATHYTLLATIEVLGKSPGTWASGKLAETMGYGRLFALGAVLSFAVLLVLWPLRLTTPGWRRAGEQAS
jgi:predicted MFS family arabinose efflux permease